MEPMRSGAIAVAVLLGACTYDDARTACERLAGSEAGPTRQRAAVCLAEYQRTGAASAGLEAARALSNSGRAEEAVALAQKLYNNPVAAEVLLLAAKVAVALGDFALAFELRERRLVLLLADGESAQASRAAHELAYKRWKRGEEQEAMAASRLAVVEADRAGDLKMRISARLGLADLLRHREQLADAERTLASAQELAQLAVSRAWIAAKYGMLYLDAAHDRLAQQHLERALALVGSEKEKTLRLSLHLNLAWILRKGGNYVRSHAELAAAAALEPEDIDVWLGRGLLLAAQGEFKGGLHEVRVAAARASDDRERFWAWYQVGQLEQKRGEVAAAHEAYQRSIRSVRALAVKAGAYVGDLAASHRLPYVRAIGLAARRGDWRGALALVLELDELALLAAERVSEDLATMPSQFAAESAVRPGSAVSVEAMLAAWRGRQLAILLSEQGTVWRLEVRDGEVTGVEVGRAEVLEAAAEALEADPGAAGPARVLGAALAPADWGAGHVDVLTIGSLSRAPLSAVVRPGDAASPLVRVLSVIPRPAGAASDNRTVVLGDPRADLPGARREALQVAEHLGVTAVLGGAASVGALAAARGAALLHVAAHSQVGDAGAMLLLADGALDAATLTSQPGAPRVVVLASCGSALARDDGRWGSLAAAFLAAGSDAVIASAWSVDDAATLQFIDELYRHPVAADPVAALAAAQKATRARLPARVWAAFTVIAAPPALAR